MSPSLTEETMRCPQWAESCRGDFGWKADVRSARAQATPTPRWCSYRREVCIAPQPRMGEGVLGRPSRFDGVESPARPAFAKPDWRPLGAVRGRGQSERLVEDRCEVAVARETQIQRKASYILAPWQFQQRAVQPKPQLILIKRDTFRPRKFLC